MTRPEGRLQPVETNNFNVDDALAALNRLKDEQNSKLRRG
jgi:hypothetical protein